MPADQKREHVLFLTGKLAEKSLIRVLESMAPTPFTWKVHELGLSVAALMTAEMIERRLTDAMGADRILVPGRCRGDLERVGTNIGVPVQRGPEELVDLPGFLGGKSATRDLSRYDTLIFAEIVDAPELSVHGIETRARELANSGADVIDLGCLPATPFPHLEEAVRHLKSLGMKVSVDSLEADELLCAGRAGADYLLSLREDTLWIADEVAATPVLIPREPGDLNSLEGAIDVLAKKGKRFLADPVLDPIHFGFTDSIARYHALRRSRPDAPILMGIGNVTELTYADTMGMNALLFGIASELKIEAVLVVQVSEHARSVLREADTARRIMFAARADNALPKNISNNMMALHEKHPYTHTPVEVAELAGAVRDPNFRVIVAEDGIHVFNRAGHHQSAEPFALWPNLGLEDDAAHAFYMGVELARAQIAFELGKRYTQDEELRWGAAVPAKADDLLHQKEQGPTLTHRRHAVKEGR
ncbi:MAG: dihydropteroate synthase [Proteobacteria bacterium]|nr:MAG: dihydropteroate synthase [Pseudomonadota bacterium]